VVVSALTNAERRAFEVYGRAAAMIRAYVAGAEGAKDVAHREHVMRVWSEIAEEIRAADAALYDATSKGPRTVNQGNISETDYVQLYAELQALARAWKDRLDIPEFAAASVLLQVGGTMAAWGGASLELAQSFVEHAWKTADEAPGDAPKDPT
jgi:hypothetical protein